MSLGTKIRELRLANGMTQSELGSGLVTPSMISQIESDKANPSYPVLEAIAGRLKTPLEYFLADIQTQLEQTTVHKVAQAMISAKQYENAARLLNSLLVVPPAHTLNLMEVKYDLGETYLYLERYDESKGLFEEVIRMATEKEQTVSVLEALNMLGKLEETRQKYHHAIYHWRKAYELFPTLLQKEPYLQSQVLSNLGNIHNKMGEFEEALRYFNDAYSLLANSNHIKEIGLTYLGLGMSYEKIREFEKATEYSQYAIAIFESLRNIKMSIDVKRNFAVFKGKSGDFEAALKLLNACLKDYKHHGHEQDAAVVEGDIARLLIHEKRFEDAIAHARTALTILPRDAVEMASIFQTLALAQSELGQTDEAITSMQRSIDLYQKHRNLTELANTYSQMAELYEKIGKLELANQCLHNMSRALKDNLKDRGLFL